MSHLKHTICDKSGSSHRSSTGERDLFALRTVGPESIQLQLFPQLPGQPARPPLLRPAQPHVGQAKLHDRTVGCDRGGAILGKQRQCPRMSGVLVENFDGLAPGRGPGRADLAQIQNVELHHSAVLEALVLDDAPIAVRLTILPSPDLPQKHDPATLARRIRRWEPGRSSRQPFSMAVAQNIPRLPENPNTPPCESARAGFDWSA